MGNELLNKKPTELVIEAELPKKELDFQKHIEALVDSVASIQLTDEQKRILYSPLKDEIVEIRPDGIIYLPWMEYVSRLRDAFGMEWAIIPKGEPRISGNAVVWSFYLIVKGKLCGFSYGEQTYYPNNLTMNWSDACEGARSNALMRLCKGIGIGLEMWKPSFTRSWKERYAEQYEKNGKKLWRKKGTELNSEEEHYFNNPDPKKVSVEITPAEFFQEMKDLALFNDINLKDVLKKIKIDGNPKPSDLKRIEDALSKEIKLGKQSDCFIGH